MEVTAWVLAVASSSEGEDELGDDLEGLLTAHEVITSTRYLSEKIVLVDIVIMHRWTDISMSTLMMPFVDYSA